MRPIVEIALFTDDVESAAGFYRRVVGADPVAEWPGGTLFAAGSVKLLVHERSGAMADGPPNEDHVAISVPDVDAAYDELREQGVAFLLEPRDYPWGRSVYLRDPDGRFVELAQEQTDA